MDSTRVSEAPNPGSIPGKATLHFFSYFGNRKFNFLAAIFQSTSV